MVDNMATRVTFNQYRNFMADFGNGKYQGQRYGQAFFNTFLDHTIDGTQPTLFYCENKHEAHRIIMDKFIDFT